MSLTSYRAAPPRVELGGQRNEPANKVVMKGSERRHPLCRPGGDLLSRALRRSTIGPGRLNDRVRNGIGWGPSGIATRSTKRMRDDITAGEGIPFALMSFDKNDQAYQAITTSN